MLIPDVFIERKADDYVKCVIKPYKTFMQFLNYSWGLLQEENRFKLYKMRMLNG